MRYLQLAKKAIVAASFLSNLGILFYFKYPNFFLSSLQEVFSIFHVQLNAPQIDVLLPVGISFYTFQALSYTMDVYRGEIYAEKNFINYALFVSFFPQLVAGPIERSKNLIKQLAVPHKFDFERFKEGTLIMIWGFILKMVIADRISAVVQLIYGDYASYPGTYLIVATVLFAFQVYCDFYGYSTIAVGAARILGVKLMENFNAPYIVTSVTEFWKCWHISLTSWFRDYLYIPLGGNRKGQARKYLNKLIVFLVSGLWHGAAMSFVVWGALNGFYQIIEELTLPLHQRVKGFLHISENNILRKLIAGIITFILVDLAWVFFCANSVTDGVNIIISMFTTYNPGVLFDGSIYDCGIDQKNWLLLWVAIGVLLLADICKRKGIVLHQVILRQKMLLRCLVFVISIAVILLFGEYGPTFDSSQFIYFQF